MTGPNNTRALDNAVRYRRELKTGLIKTYEHIKADEEKKLTKAFRNTIMSKLCREENLRKVRWHLMSNLESKYVITGSPVAYIMDWKPYSVFIVPEFILISLHEASPSLLLVLVPRRGSPSEVSLPNASPDIEVETRQRRSGVNEASSGHIPWYGQE